MPAGLAGIFLLLFIYSTSKVDLRVIGLYCLTNYRRKICIILISLFPYPKQEYDN